MKYVIYLDVIWIQNTILDVIFLILLSKCRKGKVENWLRIIMGGIAGGLFSTAFYCVPLFRANQILYELLSCLAMIFIALRHEGNYKKQIRTLCMESCLLHGMLFGVAGVWRLGERWGIPFHRSFWLTVLLTCALGIMAWVYLNRHRKVRVYKYAVRLFYADKVLETEALADTGNTLKEPLTGMPVSIIERSALCQILAEPIQKTELCIIPYHSIGRSGVLYGIKFSKMEIVKEEKTIVRENAIVAIYKGKLHISKGCQMILHPDIL